MDFYPTAIAMESACTHSSSSFACNNNDVCNHLPVMAYCI